MSRYPKRLIEVDLPIKRISAHARREKSIRHGHISTLHIWWARRPLAACRAVICAALWPDPVDDRCPPRFRDEARSQMLRWSENDRLELLSPESYSRFHGFQKQPETAEDNLELQKALLDFIADFANWDNSTKTEFLETSRRLTQVAHEALGGIEGTRPLVVDPFAGGGAIPLEALRVGADAFASDLNPVAVLLNKVVLEYIPQHGQQLADEVRKWGQWIKEEAEKELGQFYPKDPDGSTPIAYLWARTIQCEGPGCGAEVPLMRSAWLSKKKNRKIALKFIPNLSEKRVDFEIFENVKPKDVAEGTVKRGSVTCPCCGFTTPVASVRQQLQVQNGGANNARLFCVVTTSKSAKRRIYRLPTDKDLKAVLQARKELKKYSLAEDSNWSIVPDEPLPPQGSLGFRVQLYGMQSWGDLFTSRQVLVLTILVKLVHLAGQKLSRYENQGLAVAVQTILSIGVSKITDVMCSLVTWQTSMDRIGHLFTRQAIPMAWDFAETSPVSNAAGDYSVTIKNVLEVLDRESLVDYPVASVTNSSAIGNSLPDEFAQCFFSDPPYYDAVPYADLSDFFYVWLKRILPSLPGVSFSDKLTPKEDECIVDEVKGKDKTYFEKTMTKAMAEGCRVISDDGIGVIVFANKSTSGWEAQLQAMIDAGWTVTGSWPIDTEMGTRLRAMNSAALASSVHIVCRPRNTHEIGDWRDVLQELPPRIQQWMERLTSEGVVGADAIFACLGPALEIFSRYRSVEKASGETVTLREYLEKVWAIVSQEALRTIFENADTSSFEADARLTAMWLWTLSTEPPTAKADDEGTVQASSGYTLEFDAARKIAQGLGAHLDKLTTLVEIKGNTARLLPVTERAAALFGKDDLTAPTSKSKAKKSNAKQLSLFEVVGEEDTAEMPWGDTEDAKLGNTTLDRVHQATILFAAGRSEALKRFLVDEGVGQDPRFWTLTNALSALYPSNSEEKRWVDGVLARKKGLGL
ncbi:adenine-specific DNA methylase [Leptolyngbya valderiana BDU 20041]|nr:adenine-specific DNA methylase [Leptolyngbya valderiana BDU 20041]